MPHHVHRFASPDALAQQAAADWLDRVRSAQQPFLTAVSGGRIARTLFQEFTRLANPCRPQLDPLHFLWADERCVPPSHPDSNFLLTRETLLDPLRIHPDRIHRLHGEDDPALAALAASQELAQLLPSRPPPPALDLILLGMGEDGHIASLFPQNIAADRTRTEWFHPATGPKPPPQRLTMSYALLTAAIDVWVLASGPGKLSALQVSLASTDTPLGQLLKARSHTRILTDIPKNPA